MSFRYVNRADLIVIGACALTLIIFSINAKLDSVIPLYLNGIIVLGTFAYWALRRDAAGMLRRSSIIGGIGGFFYTFIDREFVASMTITYNAYVRKGTYINDGIRDIEVLATPASVVLTWMYCIAIAIYLYQRLRSLFSRFYIPSVLTGASAFLSGIVLNYLGDRAGLWVWNFGVPPSPGIGSVPLFVPVALFFTFFLSPYIIGGQRISARIRLSDNPIASGLRCAIILAMTVLLSFRMFTVLTHVLVK